MFHRAPKSQSKPDVRTGKEGRKMNRIEAHIFKKAFGGNQMKFFSELYMTSAELWVILHASV